MEQVSSVAQRGGNHLQQPCGFLTPRTSSGRIRPNWNGVVRGLPRRLPAISRVQVQLAPGRGIIARSNSLNHPNIPNSILPDGGLVGPVG